MSAPSFSRMVLAILSSSGAAAPVDNPGFAIAGDSIPQFSAQTFSLNSTYHTIARDTNGLVTITTSNTGSGPLPFGDQAINLSGMTDSTFNVFGQGHNHNTSTYYVQTAVTGQPVTASSAICANGQVTICGSLFNRYLWSPLQSAFGGGLRMQGVFAQGGQMAYLMTGVGNIVDQAAVACSHFVILTCGTNDNKSGRTTAQTIAAVQACIDTVTARGKKVFWTAITPLGTGISNYATYNAQAQTINAAIAAYVDNVSSFVVDFFSSLYDGVSAAYTWATTDSVHWSPAAADIAGTAAAAVIGPKITAHALLPASSGGALGASYATRLRDRGIWVTPSTAGNLGTGQTSMAGLGTFTDTGALQTAFPAASNSGSYALVGTGPYTLYRSDGTSWATGTAYTGGSLNPANAVVYSSIPPSWEIRRGSNGTTGTHTSVNGTVDPGDGKSLAYLSIITFTSATDQAFIYPEGTVQVSLTSGTGYQGSTAPAAGDRFKIVCELAYSNWQASNASGLRLHAQSNNSGTYLTVNGGDDVTLSSPGTKHPDSGTMILESGVMTMPLAAYGDTAPVSLGYEIEIRAAGASTTPLTVRVRNLNWVKVTDSTCQ